MTKNLYVDDKGNYEVIPESITPPKNWEMIKNVDNFDDIRDYFDNIAQIVEEKWEEL